MKKNILFCAVISAFGTNNYSQNTDNDSIKTLLLDQVVITATRTPKTLKSVPVVTRLITEGDIKKVDATNVQDLLVQELPGLEFTYSMNQQTSINLSGFGGNSVLFLVDGERLAGETLDNVDYSRLNLDNVGRIEIVKGAASTLYGSNAIGGVVNIISRSSSEPFTLNINSRYGRHNEWRHGLSTSFSAGKFTNNISVQRTSVDRIKLSDNPESSIKDVYSNNTWNVKEKFVVAPVPELRITGRAGFFFRERESSEASHDRYRDYSAGLKGAWNISDLTTAELSYSFDQYDKSDYNTISRNDIRDYSNVQNIVRMIFNQKIENHTLVIGGDYMRDYLMTYQFANGEARRQHNIDVFGQFDWQAAEHCSLLTGIRYDYFSEADANSVTGKVAAMYNTPHCSLRINYAGGFRAPTLKEMYMEFDMASIFMIYGNEKLKPEKSNNFSLSVEHASALTHLQHNFVATGYCNFVTNRITTAWNQELNGMKYINMNNIKVLGVDAAYTAKTDAGIGLKLSYAFVHEIIKKGEPETSNTRPHTATARIDYDKHWRNYSFNIALSGRYLSPVEVDEYKSMQDNTETTKVNYDGYSIWKLTLIQHIWKGISLSFAADNIFNYKPKVYYNNSPSTSGLNCQVGLSVDVDKLFK